MYSVVSLWQQNREGSGLAGYNRQTNISNLGVMGERTKYEEGKEVVMVRGTS